MLLTLNGLFSIDQLDALVRGLLRSGVVDSNTNLASGYLNVLIKRGGSGEKYDEQYTNNSISVDSVGNWV